MQTFIEYLIETVDTKKELKQLMPKKKLNNLIWDNKLDTLLPEVREKLEHISDEFIEYLKLPKKLVKDIIFTGSLANYNYTKYSDIDLHIILKSKTTSPVGEFDIVDILKTKKSLWNETHDIQIKGYDVELYVQLSDEELTAGGIYSIKTDEWINKPSISNDITYDINEEYIEGKVAELIETIDDIIDNEVNDVATLDKLIDKIWELRKRGLKRSGELSNENLVFKILRNKKYIAKLLKYVKKVKDQRLSLKRK